MPAGTIVGIAGMAVLVGVHAAFAVNEGLHGPTNSWTLVLWSTVISVFLIWGHPLARQASRFVVVISGVLLAPGFAAVDTLPVLVGSLAVAAAVFWGLGTRASRRYFDLHCVICNSYRTVARSFWFNRIVCSNCKQEWKLRERRMDPSVFD